MPTAVGRDDLGGLWQPDAAVALVLVRYQDGDSVVEDANPMAYRVDPRLAPGRSLRELGYHDSLAAIEAIPDGYAAIHHRTVWHNGLRDEPYDLFALRSGGLVLLCYRASLDGGRVEHELLRNDAVLQAIRETAFDGIVVAEPVLDGDGLLVDLVVVWSSAAAQRNDPRLTPGCSYRDLYGGIGPAPVLDVLRRGGTVRDAMLEWVDGHGVRRRFLYQVVPAGDRVVLEYQDLTAELDALDALADANRHLAHAQALAHLGSWELDRAVGRLQLTEEVLRILGLPAGAAVASPREALDLVHPDDRDTLRRLVRTAEEHPSASLDTKARIVRPSGEERVVLIQGGLIHDPGRGTRLVGTVMDVTEQDRAQRILAESEARFRRLAEQLPDVVLQLRLRPDPGVLYASPDAQATLGVSAEQLTWPLAAGSPLDDEDRGRLEAASEDGIGTYTTTVRWRHADGRRRWLEVRARGWEDPDGQVLADIVLTDVTERLRAERRTAMSAAAHMALLAREPLGEVLGRVCEDLVDLYDLRGAWVATALPDGTVRADAAAGVASADGPDAVLALPLVVDGAPIGVLNLASTHEHLGAAEVEEELTSVAAWVALAISLARSRELTERLATHDPLTGLPNRTLLLDRVQVALAGTTPGNLLLVVLDLDGFGGVNALQGGEAGDRLLVDIGHRLTAAVRPGDTVARLASDTFAVLCVGVEDDPDTSTQVERLRRALTAPSGATAGLGASLGVVVTPTPAPAGVDAEGLLRDAEIALHRARAGHPGSFEYFDASLRDEVFDRLRTLAELKDALEHDEFVVHYQPEIDLVTQRIVAVEALVRWAHPTHGLLLPGRFLSLVEHLGRSGDLGRIVRRHALADLRDWRERLSGSLAPLLSLNVSATELARADAVEALREDLVAAALPPRRVVVEVLEQALVGGAAMRHLARLAAIGVQVAIDDFGTGYSSLASLVELPLDVLKIDRSFIAGLDRGDRRAGAVVAATIDLGHRLGLRIVGEGVETVAQCDVLSAFGCDLAQGDLLGPPMPAAELLAMLEAQGPAPEG